MVIIRPTVLTQREIKEGLQSMQSILDHWETYEATGMNLRRKVCLYYSCLAIYFCACLCLCDILLSFGCIPLHFRMSMFLRVAFYITLCVYLSVCLYYNTVSVFVCIFIYQSTIKLSRQSFHAISISFRLVNCCIWPSVNLFPFVRVCPTANIFPFVYQRFFQYLWIRLFVWSFVIYHAYSCLWGLLFGTLAHDDVFDARITTVQGESSLRMPEWVECDRSCSYSFLCLRPEVVFKISQYLHREDWLKKILMIGAYDLSTAKQNLRRNINGRKEIADNAIVMQASTKIS